MAKFNITFKTPDAVSDAIAEHTNDKDEASALHEAVAKWVKRGEYITVEFDTEKGTATVKPA